MSETTRHSRWFQFSLRTLLVLMLVVAAYFAGFRTARKLDEQAIQDARDTAAEHLEVARQHALMAEERAAVARALADEAMFRAATQPSTAGGSNQASSGK
jgi:hypothetical protein